LERQGRRREKERKRKKKMKKGGGGKRGERQEMRNVLGKSVSFETTVPNFLSLQYHSLYSLTEFFVLLPRL
jgi:hypothetical protein